MNRETPNSTPSQVCCFILVFALPGGIQIHVIPCPSSKNEAGHHGHVRSCWHWKELVLADAVRMVTEAAHGVSAIPCTPKLHSLKYSSKLKARHAMARTKNMCP